MIYDCKKCGKVFKQKGHYTYHIGRIRPCIKEINNTQDTNTTNIIDSQIPQISQNIPQIYQNIPQNPQNIPNIDVNIKKNNKQILFNCINCNKNFTKKFNLDRHNIKGCKKKNEKKEIEEMKIKDEKIEELIKKVEELEIIIKKKLNNKTINNKIINNNNIQNNNIQNNNIQNNNIIISFGREDIYKLTPLEMKQILKSNDNSNPLLRIIEKMHFNKKIPEQMNLKMNNIKSPYLDVNIDNKWKKENASKIIETLLDNHTCNLSMIINELDNTIDKKITKLSEYYIKMYTEFNRMEREELEYEDGEDIIKRNKEIKKNINNIIDEIKIFLYNQTKEKYN